MSPLPPTAAQALLVLAGTLALAACGDTSPSPSPSAASTPEPDLSAIACATDDSTDVGELTGVWAADNSGVYYIRLQRDGWARLKVGTPDTYAPHAQGKFPTPSGKVASRPAI